MSNKNTIKKKKIHTDCYALDYSWLLWLKERLPVYLRDADRIVDLGYYKQSYNGKEYTQKEAILEMIGLVDYLTNAKYLYDWSDEYYEKCDILCDLWKLWWRSLWW